VEKVTWTDELGRKYLVRVENGIPPEEFYMCPRIGPPEGIVDELGLPTEFATRLHNILFDRQLWTIQEVRRQQGALLGALQAALNIDVHTLHSAYDKYFKGTE
jgi:hypothetical protein